MENFLALYNKFAPFLIILCVLGFAHTVYRYHKQYKTEKSEKRAREERKLKNQQKKSSKKNSSDSAGYNVKIENTQDGEDDDVKVTTLPTSPSSPTTLAVLSNTDDCMTIRKESNKKKILIVDDSKSALAAMRKVLINANFDIIEAKDGADAYNKMIAENPSLIITDIEMPVMDGFVLLKRIRSNLKFSELPVIMVTGNLGIHIDIGDKQGANGFLNKPYNHRDLLDQVDFLIHF